MIFPPYWVGQVGIPGIEAMEGMCFLFAPPSLAFPSSIEVKGGRMGALFEGGTRKLPCQQAEIFQTSMLCWTLYHKVRYVFRFGSEDKSEDSKKCRTCCLLTTINLKLESRWTRAPFVAAALLM